jgi:NADPH-dependent ferric siderophore reductase
VTVTRVHPVTPRLTRVTFHGSDLEGLRIEEPAASVRLLLPAPGATELVMPAWTGNEFLLPDGSRPALRTFTPRRIDHEALELDLEIVMHDGGVASRWAEVAQPGDPAAISGPGRGFTIAPDASAFVLVGDETAIPAISQLLEALPTKAPVEVHIEVAHPDAQLDLPAHPRMTASWHQLPTGAPPGAALIAAVTDIDLSPGAQVWVAAEAAAVQKIRRHLFDDRGLPRSQTTVRGYWKHGRGGE